jgi:hypothetical protein
MTEERLCACGCGGKANWPARYILGHHFRGGKYTTVHGMYGTPTYISWLKMKDRCTNPRANRWHLYGGRGITICERWISSFKNFLEDMGERPDGTTLDRIDPDGNYEPGNVRWATSEEQNRNQRRNKGM